MTKECYDELLAKANWKYKEPRPGVFWCDISEKWDFSLDFTDVLPKWSNLGFKWKSYDTEPDENGKTNLRLDFLDADGEVVGHFLTIPGCGFYWEWPQLIMDILHYEEKLVWNMIRRGEFPKVSGGYKSINYKSSEEEVCNE